MEQLKLKERKFDRKPLLLSLVTAYLLVTSSSMYAQQPSSLRDSLQRIAASFDGDLGIAIAGPGPLDTVSVNGGQPFPMQSVFKLPLAIAVLQQVEKGKLALNHPFRLYRRLLDTTTHSPLLQLFKTDTLTLTLDELLALNVGKSDNNACDFLFGLVGGPSKVNRSIQKLGIKGMKISAIEDQMKKSWSVQFKNSSTPKAALSLLQKFYDTTILNTRHWDYLWHLMVASVKPDRIGGLLPDGAEFAHKPGTSDRNKKGIRAAFNDIGIVRLPNGRKYSIAIFISNTAQEDKANAGTIAKISKLAFDHFSKLRTPEVEEINVFDSIRHRSVPVRLYHPAAPKSKMGLVLISPGYGFSIREYSFLAEALGGNGFLVAVVQNEIEGDEPLAKDGNLYKLRMNNWIKGVRNLNAVANQLHNKYPIIDTNYLFLVGHSNGGDLSALFTQTYPEKVARLVTLDNRRMPLPRLNPTKILSIRADEFEADKGVLPDELEQRDFNIEVIKLRRVKHVELSDLGSERIKIEVKSIIGKFFCTNN